MPIIENMPAEEYFEVEAASNSGLKLVMRSPAHFRYPEPDKADKRTMTIGTAFHAAVLEPDHFAKHYLVSSVDDRRLAEYKGLAKDVGGDRVLTITENRQILSMRDAIYANSRAKRLIMAPGRNELSVFSTDPITGVPVKCRFDKKGDAPTALDLKKTPDARGHAFSKVISDLRYYMAVAYYSDVWFWETGEKIKEFPLIAVEPESPHGCICHDLDEIALMLGRKHYREALNTYAACLESGKWPAYEMDSEPASVTAWLAEELFGELEMGGL